MSSRLKIISVLFLSANLLIGAGCVSRDSAPAQPAVTGSSSEITPKTLSEDQQAFLKKYNLAEPTNLRPMGKFKINDLTEEDTGNFDSIVCGYLTPGPEILSEFGPDSPYQCALLSVVDVYDADVKKALEKDSPIGLVDGIYSKEHPDRLGSFSPNNVTKEQLQLFKTLYDATPQKPLCVKVSFGVPDSGDGACGGTAIKLEPVMYQPVRN